MNGILIVDKPSGWTSQDVVSRLRGLLHERRIGHGGTLDPMATGVLPVFVGRATRAAAFFESAEKEYIAGLRLGLRTDTEDITGTVLSSAPVCAERQTIEAALEAFRGERWQTPPMYSAVKVGGRKLYELARAGREIERAPRRITIRELVLLDGEGADWRFRVRCSKGTYVRTLCRELGDALGCGGCMASLRRTQAGSYTLAQAIPLAAVEACAEEARAGLLLPTDSLFSALPSFTADAAQEKAIRNGAEIAADGLPDGEYRVYGGQNVFLMLGRCETGRLRTVRSFFEVK